MLVSVIFNKGYTLEIMMVIKFDSLKLFTNQKLSLKYF